MPIQNGESLTIQARHLTHSARAGCLTKFIKEKAAKSSYEGIELILESIEKAKTRLRANVNFDLVMELLLLTIKEN